MTRLRRSGWLRRRWLLLLVLPVAAVLAAWLAQPPTTYTASAIMRVPAGEDALSPGQPVEASYLAETYARIIPADETLPARAARAARVDLADVQDSIDALQLPGSSLIEITVSKDSAELAQRIADATVVVLSDSLPVSDALPSDVLVPVSSSTAERTSLAPWQLYSVAGLAGLLLAALLIVVLERMDPRVDTPEDVAALLTCPALELSGDSAGSLVDAWDGLSGDVELIPLTEAERESTDLLFEAVVSLARVRSRDVHVTTGEVPGALRRPTEALRVGVLRRGSRRSALLRALRDLATASPWVTTQTMGRHRSRPTSEEMGWLAGSLDLLLLAPRSTRALAPPRRERQRKPSDVKRKIPADAVS